MPLGFVPPLTPTEVDAAFAGEYGNCSVIHNGGQAAVFRAVPRVSGPRVALKIYYPSSPVDDIWARSAREVAAMRAIACTSVVRLHAHGIVSIRRADCPYICTDFIEGTTIAVALASGPMTTQAVATIGCNLLTAIEALWARKLVHRDITPRNVMLRSSGEAVLIDLGLARHLELDSLTVTGNSWGTNGYLSPEQCEGWKRLTCKSDVFTLGVVLHECLLGRHPTGRQQAALRGGLPRISGIALASPFADLLASMTAREPVRRPMPAVARTQLETFR